MWAAVNRCGDVHGAIRAPGVAKFADPAHNGGHRRENGHAFPFYDACSRGLDKAFRALVALRGNGGDVATRIAVVAAAYEAHASRGGFFVDFGGVVEQLVDQVAGDVVSARADAARRARLADEDQAARAAAAERRPVKSSGPAPLAGLLPPPPAFTRGTSS